MQFIKKNFNLFFIFLSIANFQSTLLICSESNSSKNKTSANLQSKQRTPLHLASSIEEIDTLLISNSSIDISALDEKQRTPVDYMVARAYNLDIKTLNKQDPEYIILRKQYIDAAMYLVSKGGFTPRENVTNFLFGEIKF